jgi:DNA-binding PadR family transcriptional regulator
MHTHDEDHLRHHQERAWRKFEAIGRRGGGWFGGAGRGFGGLGGAGGDWGGFGDNIRSFRIGRMLASGDLRLIALYFIDQQPRHGYDLIKAIEEKTGGIYSPSPGVIYPALTFLEEANHVTSQAEANKRLYTITEEGRAYLNDNRAAVETTLAHLDKVGVQFAKVRERWEEAGRYFREEGPPRPDRDMADVAPEVNEARRELKDAIRTAARNRNPDNQRQLADILRRAAEEVRRGGDAPREPDDVDL